MPNRPNRITHQNSKIEHKLFWTFISEKTCEGGLRTKGYFKSLSKSNQEKQTLQPLVTIITVVFNGQKYLAKTIESVLNQSYDNIEYIIIDGNSNDGTLPVIQQYENFIDYWISEPDSGIYDAMNKGIQLAAGDLIGILNCGDWYVSDAVSQVVNLYLTYYNYHQSKKYLIISGAMIRFDEQLDITFKTVRSYERFTKRINQAMEVNHPSTFVESKLYKAIGGFDTNLVICGDYDFILRSYYSEIAEFVFTDRVLSYMMLGGISESFSGIFWRAYERFLIRRTRILWLKNIYSSVTWLFINLTKNIAKNILHNTILSIYYDYKKK